MRFAGIKNGRIRLISWQKFSSFYDFVEVPAELDSVSNKELILNYQYKNNKFINPNIKQNAKDLKVAFVSNWKMKCGISTYAENLFPEIIKHVGDFRLFIEENTRPTSNTNNIGGIEFDGKVVSCWKRGESLQKLAEKIKEYNPDIVVINNEFGIFPNARYWLSFLTQISEYRIITILHSVYHHKDKSICEIPLKEIVVHLDEAKSVLKEEKGIPGTVHVIPHGCEKPNKQKLWNLYKTEHTIIQQGFGFRYKNFESSIKAVFLLRENYPDIFLTILFGESDFNQLEHRKYHDELIELLNRLGLQENVAIVTGYFTDEALNSYYRTNNIAIFPYVSNKEHIVYGASGAARTAMAKSIPVITSSIPHFSDLPTIKADTIEDIAKNVGLLFYDKNLYKEQIDIQNHYLEENSWDNTALKYIKVFENG